MNLKRSEMTALLAAVALGALTVLVVAIVWATEKLAVLPEAGQHVVVVGAFCALPFVAWASYNSGRSSDKQRYFDEGFDAGARAAQFDAESRIEGLRLQTEERGDAFLKGAEKGLGQGLGSVGSMVKTREAARPQRQEPPQVAVILPQVGSGAFTIRKALGDGEDIDL